MTLNEYVAQLKREILAEIESGRDPGVGRFDRGLLDDLRAKGRAQIGPAVLSPDRVRFEFIFQLPDGESSVFSVDVEPPERIVHMPVPEWVVESVWQGEVQGSFHFESDAVRLMEKFRGELAPGENEKWFAPRPPVRRE